MRRFLGVSTLALASFLSPASASAQTCSAPAAVGDACAVASDLFRYMAPQFGTAIAGGSHTLGLGTNLGGFPHFAIAVRANAVVGNMPTINDVQPGAAAPRNFAVEDGGAAMVTADFALGLTKGFNVGVSRIGGVDLIGGVTYVPTLDGDNYAVNPQSNVSVGLGARIGLLQQSALIPGVAFSYMRRNLPTLDADIAADDGSSFNLNDFSIKTSSWRLSAQKNLLLFQLGAGIGGDTYDFSTAANVTTTGPAPIGTVTGTMTDKASMSRTTMYGSLGVNLFLVKIVVEGGQVSGGNLVTRNTFDTPADAKRLYANVGLRVNF